SSIKAALSISCISRSKGVTMMKVCARLRFYVFLVLSVSLITGSSWGQSRPTAIVGGTLIDGTGRPALTDSAIIMQDGRFIAVGKRGEVSLPQGADVIDAKGKTILPGLIDGHCHLRDWMGELYLHFGITTCPDITQNDDEWTLTQRDGTNLGKIRGPRIWSTGARLVGPPPPWALRGERGYLIKTPEDAIAAVR